MLLNYILVGCPWVSLCDLFNKSLLYGTFSDDWKCARVTPLFRQGEASDYRPISVISVIAKVFERVVYDQSYNFLSNEDIISTHQSGFRSLHLTVTDLLKTTDNWAFKIDRVNVNAGVVLDLKKAFDTVDHDILLPKMNLYRIQGIALDWSRSYLTNRTHRCLFLESVHLKAGYLREQFLVPFYFLFCFSLLFSWARLNILIFLPILGWKYSCIIL